MNPTTAINHIHNFIRATEIDRHGRYLSWNHCYNAFCQGRGDLSAATVDLLSLHLAFYLASWGMYRGSSFLLQKDYKVHTPVVRIVLEPQYNVLCGISATNLMKEENMDLLIDLSQRIKSVYEEEHPSFEDRPNHATNTLISKILLGTLGCVPAFDRYFVQSVKKHGICNGHYTKESIQKIAKYYLSLESTFEALRYELNQGNTTYPPMKLIDMCFWQDGFTSENN